IEDEEVFSLDFRTAYPYHYHTVPTLESLDAVTGDEHGDFRFHREFLQHLQWNSGRRRWVCKSVTVQNSLDALFEIYPDALCVWAHRPVAEIYASIVALSTVIYDTIQGRPSAIPEHARVMAEGMKAALDRLMATALIDDPRILHLRFRDLAKDPVG